MNHKRKSNRRRVWRKTMSAFFSIKGWSRMLHKWWKKDAYAKHEFNKIKNKRQRMD